MKQSPGTPVLVGVYIPGTDDRQENHSNGLFSNIVVFWGGGGIRGETCVDLLDYFSWGKKCISLAIYIQKIAIASVLLRNKYVFLPTRRTLKSN